MDAWLDHRLITDAVVGGSQALYRIDGSSSRPIHVCIAATSAGRTIANNATMCNAAIRPAVTYWIPSSRYTSTGSAAKSNCDPACGSPRPRNLYSVSRQIARPEIHQERSQQPPSIIPQRHAEVAPPCSQTQLPAAAIPGSITVSHAVITIAATSARAAIPPPIAYSRPAAAPAPSPTTGKSS